MCPNLHHRKPKLELEDTACIPLLLMLLEPTMSFSCISIPIEGGVERGLVERAGAFSNVKSSTLPDALVHAFNFTTLGSEAADLLSSSHCLVYIVSSRQCSIGETLSQKGRCAC